MVGYTLEVAWRGIEINFMKNQPRISIFVTATRRVYCVGTRLSLPPRQSDPRAPASRTDSHPGAAAADGQARPHLLRFERNPGTMRTRRKNPTPAAFLKLNLKTAVCVLHEIENRAFCGA